MIVRLRRAAVVRRPARARRSGLRSCTRRRRSRAAVQAMPRNVSCSRPVVRRCSRPISTSLASRSPIRRSPTPWSSGRAKCWSTARRGHGQPDHLGRRYPQALRRRRRRRRQPAAAEFQELFPGEDINVAVTEDSVILSGAVSNNDVMLRAAEIARAAFPKSSIVNMLQLPGGSPSKQVMLQVRFAEVNRNALLQAGLTLFAARDSFAARSTTQQFAAPRFRRRRARACSSSPTT